MSDLTEVNNSLSSLANGLYNGGALGAYGGTSAISSVATLGHNNRNYLISNFRQLLSESYIEHGIIQTLVDQPVDDAFSRGIEIKSSQLDRDDIELLENYIDRHNILDTIKMGIKWKRLFGGGAVLIITDEKPDTEFDVSKLSEKSKVEFKAVDMWELYSHKVTNKIMGQAEIADKLDPDEEYYHYYGKRIHHSRVIRLEGKEAPSFVRPRLRGWGLSEVEKVVRSFNQYLKNQEVVFELLDEAKVDVYKMEGFNAALLTSTGTDGVAKRIQTGNMMKNFQNAITMDKEDEYDQKQMSFAGLSDILKQIREGIAADLKIPVTKLFGISSAGFNSGEDDIENYNAMIESEIRAKDKGAVLDVVGICCQLLFGLIPDDLMISFPSLRIMSTKEEEEIKNMQFGRISTALQTGGITGEEYKQAINKEDLMPIEIDESIEIESDEEGTQNDA